MKKNKAMRAAGVLVIATLLTTCLTAGTFAKYTTTDSATDSARVAKFGVTVVANGSLYGNAYTKADTNTPEIQTNNNDTITVKAADDKNVVAPGTKNESGIGFAVNGTPEVDVALTATVKAKDIFLKAGDYGVMVQKPAGVVTAENFTKLTTGEELYTKDGDTYTKATEYATSAEYYVLQNKVNVAADYYPVVYTYVSANNDKTTGKITEIAAEVAGKLAGATVTGTTESNSNKTIYTVNSNVVKNNTNLATALNLGSEKITWVWEFEKDAATNAKDTILGDLQGEMTGAAVVVKNTDGTYKAPKDGTDYNLNTSFEVSITVDQVD